MIISRDSITNRDKIDDLLEQTERKGECLEWLRCFNTDGYPRMGVKGNPNIKVHRLMAELFYEEDISGMVVRHSCDNIKCINPEHLLLGSQHDNNRDMVERGRYRIVYCSELIDKVQTLLGTGEYSQKEIAQELGIDPRRVSDIYTGKLMR